MPRICICSSGREEAPLGGDVASKPAGTVLLGVATGRKFCGAWGMAGYSSSSSCIIMVWRGDQFFDVHVAFLRVGGMTGRQSLDLPVDSEGVA